MNTFLQTLTIRSLIVSAFIALATLAMPAAPAYAGTTTDTDNNNATCATNDATKTGIRSGIKCAKSGDQKANLGNVIETVTNVLLFIIGAVSVIMIIIGGIKYVLSNGDASQVTSAKNTILYAVIGLVVALLAYAIVNFVIDSFMNNNGTSQERT